MREAEGWAASGGEEGNYCSHFTEEETVPEGKMACLESYSQYVAELGLKSLILIPDPLFPFI